MKIAVNLLNYTSQLAGNGTFARRVLGRLQELDRTNRYDLYVRAGCDMESVFQIYADNFRVMEREEVLSRSKRILFEQFQFPRILSNGAYDLFYSPSLAVPLRLRNLPMVNTVHDLSPFYVKKYPPLRDLYYKQMCRRTSKRVHHIVAVSENTKNDIVNLLGVAPEKVSVVYNFLDDGYADSVPPLPEETKLASDDYFFFIGTLQPGKNIVNLLRAWSEYRREYASPSILALAGKPGWGSEDYVGVAKTLGVSESVRFLGYVDDDTLRSLYAHASALVYPSLYEGFGIPPLEAMTIGTAVVVSRGSSLPEVVGDAGDYVEPTDPSDIARGMRDAYLGRNGSDRNEKMAKQSATFDGEREARKLLRVFERFAS